MISASSAGSNSVGFEARETEEQMQIFAEEVMPVIASECGGKVELPARGLNLLR